MLRDVAAAGHADIARNCLNASYEDVDVKMSAGAWEALRNVITMSEERGHACNERKRHEAADAAGRGITRHLCWIIFPI